MRLSARARLVLSKELARVPLNFLPISRNTDFKSMFSELLDDCTSFGSHAKWMNTRKITYNWLPRFLFHSFLPHHLHSGSSLQLPSSTTEERFRISIGESSCNDNNSPVSFVAALSTYIVEKQLWVEEEMPQLGKKEKTKKKRANGARQLWSIGIVLSCITTTTAKAASICLSAEANADESLSSERASVSLKVCVFS